MDYVELYLKQLTQILNEMPRDQIREVVEVLLDAWKNEANIFLLGNGGSAATASHMANDLNKLTIVPGQRRFRAIALTDNVPLITAWGNDTNYENVFAEQLLNFVKASDVVIGISTSGNSANVLKALIAAKERRAITIGFTGKSGGCLKSLVDYCIFVPSDHVGQLEDAHMVLDHVISGALREMVSQAVDPQ